MDLITSRTHDLEAARLRNALMHLGFSFVEFRPQPVLGSN